MRQSKRWKQEGGQGKSNRISLALESSYMAEFTEFETHKVSTEEVIFSSTAGSPTKTKKLKKKKERTNERKKTGFHSLLLPFKCSDKESLFSRVLSLTIKSGSKELTFTVYSLLYMHAALTQYIIISYTYCFREKFVRMYISD